MHDVYKYSPIIYMYMLLLEEYNMLFRVLAKGVKVMPHPPFLVSFPLMLLCFWHCHPPFSELWLKPWWCWDTLCLIQLCLFGYCEQTVSSDYYTCSWHLEYKCITSQKNMMNDNCYAMDRRDVHEHGHTTCWIYVYM